MPEENLIPSEMITLTNAEIRARMYRDHVDPLLAAALGYERENNTVKAAELWAQYDAKKAEIRATFPDEPAQ